MGSMKRRDERSSPGRRGTFPEQVDCDRAVTQHNYSRKKI
jgi:hypothetical protein